MERIIEKNEKILSFLDHKIGNKKFAQIIESLEFLKNQFICIYETSNDEMIYQKNIQELLGYPPVKWSVAQLYNAFHPEDREKIMKVFDRIKNHYLNKSKLPFDNFSFTARIRKANGKIMQIHVQEYVIHYQPDNGQLTTLSIGTDISHFNLDHTVKVNISGPGSDELDFTDILEEKNIKISLRERQVLKYLAEGFDSISIASDLKISVHTVNTHRRNLIKRFKCDNTAQLISVTSRMGILD